MDYNALTERINYICYKLEHYSFLSTEDKINLLKELGELVAQRNQLLETLDKK